jgi:hypothetical protein
MGRVDGLFNKWQGWIRGDLLAQFRHLMKGQQIYFAFLDTYGGFVDRLGDSEVATWMILNHYESTCIAIRRLDDKDPRSVSLRRLLLDLQRNVDVLTDENLAIHNSTYRRSQEQGVDETSRIKVTLGKEIELLDAFGGQIKEFVNKLVAHRDEETAGVMIPTALVVERAAICYHAIFRKYAFTIAGIPCRFENPDPLDILPPSTEDHRQQFARMWNAIAN